MFVILLELSDEQKEYRDLARKFCREEIVPSAPHYDKTGEVSLHLEESYIACMKMLISESDQHTVTDRHSKTRL